MANPDYNSYLCELWGWPNEIGYDPFAGASNIVVGTNPAYAIADFLELFPQFAGSDDAPILPKPVLQAYITLASASLIQARYMEAWPLAMGYYIAHFATLYLRAAGSPGAGQTLPAAAVAQRGISSGITVSKSAGGVSVSYQPLAGLDEWAAWNLTSYGQLFATMAKAVGSGAMLVY